MGMDVEYFFEKLKEKVKEVWGKDIYDDIIHDGLTHSVWTSLIDTAIYLLVDEYNEKNNFYNEHKEEKVCIVPENQLLLISGEKRYSDFLLVSNRGRKRCIEIEHENKPKKRVYKSVENLSRSEADYKVIITYSSNKIPKQLIEKQIKKAKGKLSVKITIYLMIAPAIGKTCFQYELIPI